MIELRIRRTLHRCALFGVPALAVVGVVLAAARIPWSTMRHWEAEVGSAGIAPVVRVYARPIALQAEPVWSNTVCAGEPVPVRVTLLNRTGRERRCSLGNDGWHLLWLSVLDDQRRPVGTPLPTHFPFQASFWSGVARIPPHGRLTEHCALAQWARIEKPGRYCVRATLREEPGTATTGRVLAEGEFALTVLPRDADRVAARCRQLAREARRGTNGVLSAEDPRASHVCLLALLSIRDDAAVKPLEALARHWRDWPEGCRALRRIGSPLAMKVLRNLARCEGELGKPARAALRKPPAPDERNADGTESLRVPQA